MDEIPSYLPCGEGEHIYLLVQKRGLSTMDLISVVASHFHVPRSSVGYAGLKDKNAITRQSISVHVPGRKVEDFPMLAHVGIEVLGAALHANKLRPGHLKGNRFSIRVRGVAPTHVRRARDVLARLHAVGVPNRVGDQRFGLLGNNHIIGRELVRKDFAAAVNALLGPCEANPTVNEAARKLFVEGKHAEAMRELPSGARTELRVLHALSRGRSPRQAMLALDEPVLRFYFSAFQSAAFNAVLDERLRAGRLGTLLPGDLAFKHENGSVFTVDDAVAVAPDTLERVARKEISPSGPLWGGDMMRAAGEQDAIEVRELARLGVGPDELSSTEGKGMLRGQRRPLRVPLIDPEVEGGVDEHGPYVRCAFELPRGSFATEVMREVMKVTSAECAEAEH